MTYDQMKETMACQVCGKPAGLPLDECHATMGKNNPLCNEYDRCRIAEKSEPQFDYAFSEIDKHIFLKACPGSGKTEIVGLKTAYEIKRWDKEVGGIAVLTFTNNAADVISERVSQFAGIGEMKYPHFIGTFDSWLHGYIAHPFGHILTEYKGQEGDRSIRVVREDESGPWLNAYKMQTSYSYYVKDKRGAIICRNGKPVIGSMPLYANNITCDHISGECHIKKPGSNKNNSIGVSEYYNSPAFVDFRSDKAWLTLEYLKSAFAAEKKRFFQAGFATYQDIEFICHLLISKNDDLRTRLALRFPLIIVDECQDLSSIQLQILSKLKEAGSILHFVGDLNQAIYEFKKVDPKEVKDFAIAEGFEERLLSKNFRSCQPIVDICQKIVNDKNAVMGASEQEVSSPCVCLIYTNKNDLGELPTWFRKTLEEKELDINKSAIVTRGWSNVSRMRPSGNNQINKYSKRLAMAIHLWHTGDVQAIEDSISYMGRFFSEKYFANSANSRKHYCPECVNSSIRWRLFLLKVLERCIHNQNLIDFTKTGTEWAKTIRSDFGQIARDCKPYIAEALTEDVDFPDFDGNSFRSSDASKPVENLFSGQAVARSDKRELRSLQPYVFAEIGDSYPKYNKEASLNAFIGSKTGEYLNLYDDVIKTPLEYQSRWIKGFLRECEKTYPSPRHMRMKDLLTCDYPYFKKYLYKFLERSFLTHYEELYKIKPKIDESEYWFGNNDDEFGLLVTPRYYDGWENDKSEIRHFKFPYWTISHVLETGLCYIREDRIRTFSGIHDYLSFFRDMVRRTRSSYQLQIADKYIDLVNRQAVQGHIPLMIPELRYDPLKRKHQHRLDFLIINPWDMSKTGFEFSPWSSHGKLKGKNKNLSELNDDAKQNFEREMKKHKKYWRKYGINYITYTDSDLNDLITIWLEIKKYLTISPPDEQLEFDFLQRLNSL